MATQEVAQSVPDLIADNGPKSIASRLPAGFKIVSMTAPDASHLHLSGPVTTQDELDAIVSALAVMKDWLPAIAEREVGNG